MDEIIKTKNLTVSYDEKVVLKNISLSFRKNKITTIIGHSGSGKSTLLLALNNLLALEENVKIEGDIFFDDKNILDFDQGELRQKIGMVFQSPTPFPISIRKNLTYAPSFYGIKDKETLSKIVTDNLKIVGLYDEVKDELNKNAKKLSGGQAQRLCIARALTARPEVLLLDEPCSSLDFENTRLIEKLLVELKEKYTIIMVTHDLAEAKRISDDVVFISDGELVEAGELKEILKNPKSDATKNYLRDIL